MSLSHSLRDALSERYTVERELGRGGMAAVFLADDRRHGRKVAIKVLDAAVAGSIGVDRFLREIRIAARLTHPHIVPLYDSGEEAGVVYYVMPFITGESLRDRLTRGPVPLGDVVRIARELAGALDYAHRQGIIHRDIKPDNILMGEGHALIADFGIARAIAEATTVASAITSTGMVVGTPAYISPEQVGPGDDPIDGRCDQYSLGCVLYEMIAGRPPFAGGTAMSLIAQHMTAPPPALHGPEPVPEAMERAIMRALAKTAADRFPDVMALAQALESAGGTSRRDAVQLPAVVSPVQASRLPVPLTPFIGRDREVTTCTALLEQRVRLLTVFGAGGIGKTRLALEVAARARSRFADDVWFVALAEVRDADSFVTRVAQAFGLRGVAASMAGLSDHLRDREALLLLDNFEQIADVAGESLAALLRECPRLKALVTSQALLHLYGEHEFRLDPLPVPAGHLGVQELSVSPAVMLFQQRATAANPAFALTADNSAAVAEICALLDGVPLAIELAAARMRTSNPQSIVARLRDSLSMLTGGPRDLPQRQRTMRGAIAWSHELLADEERALLRKLAVFAGGVTAPAAAAICMEDADPEAAVILLDELADRSFLMRQVDAVGEARFTMLRPVHAFAAEMLDEAEELDDVADRHSVYFRALALEGESHVMSDDDVWLDRLESDHHNLRRAMSRLLERGLVADALRMGTALWRYWDARSYAREGMEQLREVTAVLPDDVPAKLRLSALFSGGVLADSCGDLAESKRFFERHLALTEARGSAAAVAMAKSNLGVIKLRQGDVDDAIPLLELAVIAMRDVGNFQAMALGTANLGNAERMRKNFDAARARYQEAREVFERINDRVNVGWSLSHMADLERDEGKPDAARARYREALSIFVSLGHKAGMASSLTDLGELVALHGDLQEARGLLEEALVQVADLGDQRAMLRVFAVMAQVSCALERDDRAVRIAGAVAGLRDRLGAPMSAVDRGRLQDRIAPAMVRLDAGQRERAWREGLQMTIDEVVRYVTTVETPVAI